MRTAIPPITDHADDLKQRLPREHDGHKRTPLQMLYLLASQQAQTRQGVARLLGSIAIPPVAGWRSMPPGAWTLSGALRPRG